MHRAISDGASEAKQTAETLVPEDNGDLKSTIDVIHDEKGHAVFSAGGQSKKSDKFVDYETHVEFGTTHVTKSGETYTIEAHPFFRPGLDAGRRKMKREMKITDR